MKFQWATKERSRTDELRRVVNEYHQNLKRQRSEIQDAAAEEKQREDRYYEVRDSVIEPAMQEVRQAVVDAGEECEIIHDDRHFPGTIILALYPSAAPRAFYTEETTPRIRFLPTEGHAGIAAQAVIEQQMVFGGYVGEWLIDQITKEDVENVLFKFVTDVFSA